MSEHTKGLMYMNRDELEDEVMELRAKLQAMTNDRDMWKKRTDGLAIEKVFGNSSSWYTANGALKRSRWNNNEGRYEPDPDDH